MTKNHAHSEAEWKQFERLVANIYRQLTPNAQVTHDEKLLSSSGQKRQFDVVVRQQVAGTYTALVVIECRDRARPTDITSVDAFAQKMTDVRANAGIIVSTSGFTSGAITQAHHSNIQLMTYREAEAADWQGLIGPQAWVNVTHTQLGSVTASATTEDSHESTVLPLSTMLVDEDDQDLATAQDLLDTCFTDIEGDLTWLRPGPFRIQMTFEEPVFTPVDRKLQRLISLRFEGQATVTLYPICKEIPEFKTSQKCGIVVIRVQQIGRGKMELTDDLKAHFTETAEQLQGWARRTFMARVAALLGKGGQRQAEAELGWCRDTIRKGQAELDGDFCYIDHFSERGRKPAEEHLPNLLDDIEAIVDGQSQTDPTFKTTRLYTRLSAAEVRRQLILQKGYSDDELPGEETIRVKLNQLGYQLRSVQKSRPQKKIPETDAIFEQLDEVHAEADDDDTVLRISMDAKATLPIGLFSRNGKTRVIVKAMDHDFKPDETLTLYGIFLPKYNELYLYFTRSRVTSDFIVDCLHDFWLTVRERFPQVETLLLNQDNGGENHSRRTQFMKRITEFVDEFRKIIQLAYYPPYHSKYNPGERVWGVLEKHWNGSLLDTVETVLNFAKTMTWNGHHPVVKLVEDAYHTGVGLTKKAMDELEERFERLPGLEKWFVRIEPLTS